MSPIAAEGLQLPLALDAMIGQGARTMAELICRLHGDETADRTMAEAGLSFIRRDFGAEATLSALRAAIDGEDPVDEDA